MGLMTRVLSGAAYWCSTHQAAVRLIFSAIAISALCLAVYGVTALTMWLL
jgi:hypothetical protein